MRLGLIARADDGGLGVQTWEIARHLRPHRILVVDNVESTRGTFHPERYDGLAGELHVARNIPGRGLNTRAITWLVDEIDTLLTVEGFYNDRAILLARERGVHVIVYANPELFPGQHRDLAERGVIRVLAPTEWEAGRLGPHEVLPMPVARDRLPYRERQGGARTLLHIAAPAFHDRHGTGILQAALREYAGPELTLHVAGPEDAHRLREPTVIGKVRAVPIGPVVEYWERYTDEIDALVLPRRYGGLSLVAQEALAAGIPTLMLRREPESRWPVMHARGGGSRHERMKGGAVEVLEGDPCSLAERIRKLAVTELHHWSRLADEWAELRSWPAQLPAWRAALGLEGTA